MPDPIAGIDEAGRGPVLGPLVVAAVRVPEASVVEGLGLRDSKALTAGQRAELAGVVRDRADVEVTSVAPDVIDRYRRQRTLNDLEVDLFGDLVARLAPVRAYVDAADVDPERFRRRVLARARGPGTMDVGPAPTGPAVRPDIEVVAEHGADVRYPVVSAASIVAKVERDQRVAEIGEELGADVGSGYPSDPVTTAFVESWFDEHGDLPPHTRRSWVSARRMLARAGQANLAEF